MDMVRVSSSEFIRDYGKLSNDVSLVLSEYKAIVRARDASETTAIAA